MSRAPFDPFHGPLAGTVLIEASAGTGKTYTITLLYLRLLLEARLSPDEILVVTFTRAATDELRDRIRTVVRTAAQALGGERSTIDDGIRRLLADRDDPQSDRQWLHYALRAFDSAAIFTIHGFCQRVLQEHAFESGIAFDAPLTADDQAFVQEIAQDFWLQQAYEAPAIWLSRMQNSGDPVARLLALAKRLSGRPEVHLVPCPLSDRIASAWQNFVAAHVRAAQAWQAPGEAAATSGQIEAAVAEKRLDGRTYQIRRLPSWISALSACLEHPDPDAIAALPQIAKFTASALNHATKPGCCTPERPVFGYVENLLQTCEDLEASLLERTRKLEHDFLAFLREEKKRRKQVDPSLSFDDLLQRLDGALQSRCGTLLIDSLRKRYRAVLVDEFQDTDPTQYRILKTLFGATPAPLLLIGDPKQAIYGFRGADIFAYLQAARDAAEQTYGLTHNWRSDPRLVQAVNSLFGRVAQPFLLAGIPFEPVQAGQQKDRIAAPPPNAAIEVLLVRRDAPAVAVSQNRISKTWANDQLPRAVAADIVRLLQSGVQRQGMEKQSTTLRPLQPGDIAVLVRKNRQALAMQEALRALHVPTVLHGQASVFDTDEAEQVQRILQAIHDPAHLPSLKAALASPLFGNVAADLLRLESEETEWDDVAQRFQRWHELWDYRGFTAAFQRFLTDGAVAQRLLALTSGERRLTNVLHLAELLQSAAVEQRLGPDSLLRWLWRMRHDPSQREEIADESAQLRLESDDYAVQLVTIHKSKGLEYPIVYAPFLWDGRLLGGSDDQMLLFHDQQPPHHLRLDLGSQDRDSHLRQASFEALAENLRMLYVAVTRARHRCTIVWGAFREADTSALAMLLHPSESGSRDSPAEHVRRLADLTDSQLFADLQSLMRESAGTVQVRDLVFNQVSIWQPENNRPMLSDIRALSRRFANDWGTSSFSQLIAVHDRGRWLGDVVLDRAASEMTESGLRDRQKPTPEIGRSESPSLGPSMMPSSRGTQPLTLRDFPAGAKTGLFFHQLLEAIDFSDRDKIGRRVCIDAALERSDFAAERWGDAVAQAVADMFQTPLRAGPTTWSLEQIDRSHRLDELEFLFPIVCAASRTRPDSSCQTNAQRFTPERLAAVFAQHHSPCCLADYANALRRLRFMPLHGFLKGFIDLTIECDGMYYLLDYKTNDLGPNAVDYGPARLAAAMIEHHYILQYHLYTVALNRYLRQRVPGYAYESHFGGIYYLFLRGMSPVADGTSGVFFDRPEAPLLRSLERLFDGTDHGEDQS